MTPRILGRATLGGLVVLLLVVLALRDGDGANGAASAQGLRTDGTRIVDAGGRPVQLRGFNMIGVWDEGSAPRGWAGHHFRTIRRRGFNTVRLVLYWSQLEPQRGRFHGARLRALDTIVKRARNAGLHVVLDPIHLFGGDQHLPRWARGGHAVDVITRHAPRYLRMLARRYRHEDAVAAYDLVNEPPTSPPDQNRILAMYGALIRSVREVEPDKILMFSPAYGDTSMAGADLSLLGPPRNLVFTLHDYYSGNGPGTGYRADGAQDRSTVSGSVYAWDGDSGYPSPDPAALERHLLVNLRIMKAAGIPTWIGEFGMNPQAPNAGRWMRDKVALFKRHGLGYAWWLYGNDGSGGALDEEHRMRSFVRVLR